MATATKVPPKPARPRISLELSYEEAYVLFALTHRVGASPVGTVRKHTEAIQDALCGAGLPSTPYEVHTELFSEGVSAKPLERLDAWLEGKKL